MGLVTADQVEVYNKFSLQHEVGSFLCANVTGYKVQFERSTKFFGVHGVAKY